MVISNMPNGAIPCFWATPSTRILVEVPISVVVPPKIAAKDNGIRSFDGAMLIALASRMATGIRMITTGVLLMKAERKMTAAIMTITAMAGEPPLARRTTTRPT